VTTVAVRWLREVVDGGIRWWPFVCGSCAALLGQVTETPGRDRVSYISTELVHLPKLDRDGVPYFGQPKKPVHSGRQLRAVMARAPKHPGGTLDVRWLDYHSWDMPDRFDAPCPSCAHRNRIDVAQRPGVA